MFFFAKYLFLTLSFIGAITVGVGVILCMYSMDQEVTAVESEDNTFSIPHCAEGFRVIDVQRDVGNLKPGQVLHLDFTVENGLGRKARLVGVQDLSERDGYSETKTLPVDLPAGKIDQIEVTFRAGRAPGAFSKVIELYVDCDGLCMVPITIQGQVIINKKITGKDAGKK